jgi:hypothetical protein
MKDDDDDDDDSNTPKNADQHDLLLLKNCDAHLRRLHNQLEDLSNPTFIERMRSPSSSLVVESMRQDTRDSMEKFATLREKLANGNLNVSSWSSTEVKKKFTLDRIRDAFETEAIYALFFERDRGGLRDRLAVVERELRLGKTKTNNDASEKEEEKLEIEKIEILVALKNLGERMTEEEKLTMREGLERGVMEDLEMLMEDV